MSEHHPKPHHPVAPEEVKEKGRTKTIARAVLIVGLLVVAVFGYRRFSWSSAHEVTDNAQVASDVVAVAPVVSGIVAEVQAEDNQAVHKGDLLVQLDPTRFEAAVAQAKANLDAALANARAAGIDVEVSRDTATAAQLSSQGAVEEGTAGIGVSEAGVKGAEAALKSAQANASASEIDVQSSRSEHESAVQGVAIALSRLRAAKSILSAANAAVATAQASLRQAESQHDYALKEANRRRQLWQGGAVSQSQVEQAETAEQAAAAALDSARSQLELAKANAAQRAAEVDAAQSQAEAAQVAVRQSNLKIAAAQQRSQAVRAAVGAAASSYQSTLASVQAARARATKTTGDVANSRAASAKVKRQVVAVDQAQARVEQARAMLKLAEVDLAHTRIVAPCDGRVTKRVAEVGANAQSGAVLLYLVPDDSLFVVANFKETQVSSLREGDPVDIEIDARPGKPLRGVVDSLAAATGSTFALLPPDNSTGNFVKVVQRVPVKIRFENMAEAREVARVGMSALVTVEKK